MTNPPRQVVQVLAGNFSKGLIKGIANNARGLINGKGRDNSPTSGIQNKSQFYTNNLAYPEDVETDPQQGHYILFHINESKGAKLGRTKKNKNIEKIRQDANKEFKTVNKPGGPPIGPNVVVVDKRGRERFSQKSSKSTAIKLSLIHI